MKINTNTTHKAKETAARSIFHNSTGMKAGMEGHGSPRSLDLNWKTGGLLHRTIQTSCACEACGQLD